MLFINTLKSSYQPISNDKQVLMSRKLAQKLSQLFECFKWTWTWDVVNASQRQQCTSHLESFLSAVTRAPFAKNPIFVCTEKCLLIYCKMLVRNWLPWRKTYNQSKWRWLGIRPHCRKQLVVLKLSKSHNPRASWKTRNNSARQLRLDAQKCHLMWRMALLLFKTCTRDWLHATEWGTCWWKRKRHQESTEVYSRVPWMMLRTGGKCHWRRKHSRVEWAICLWIVQAAGRSWTQSLSHNKTHLVARCLWKNSSLSYKSKLRFSQLTTPGAKPRYAF